MAVAMLWVFVRLALAFGLWLVFSSNFRTYPPSLWYVGAFLPVAAGCAGFLPLTQQFFVLGLVISVLPFFSAGFLSCFILGLCLFPHRPISWPRFRDPLTLGLLGMFSWYVLAAAHTWIVGDWLLLSSIWQGGGYAGFLRYLSMNTLVEQRALTELCGVIVAFLLGRWALQNSESDSGQEKESAGLELRFSRFVYGLSWGVVANALVAFCQISDIHPVFRFNLSEFWRQMNRVSGLMTDPNALGVFFTLATPIMVFLLMRRRVYALSCMAFLSGSYAMVVSGTRTVFLGVGVWLIVTFFHLRQVSCKASRVIVGLFAIMVVLFAGAFLSPGVANALQRFLPFATWQRLLQTLSSEHAAEMLSSKFIVWRVALKIWLDNFYFGVGLGRFFQKFPSAATDLSLNAPNWSDNANSFYLGVLSETGLVGALLLFPSLVMVWWILCGKGRTFAEGDNGQSGAVVICCRMAVTVFLAVLLLGPHQHFEEVLFLMAILTGVILPYRTQKSISWSWVAYLTLVILTYSAYLISYPVSTTPRNKGLYPVESVEGKQFRWTGQRAKFAVRTRTDGKLLISFRAANPDLGPALEDQLIVDLQAENREPERVVIKSSDWQAVLLPIAQSAGDCIPVSLVSSRSWSPADFQKGWVDARYFGVMLDWNADICSVD